MSSQAEFVAYEATIRVRLADIFTPEEQVDIVAEIEAEVERHMEALTQELLEYLQNEKFLQPGQFLIENR